jgi:hypothetical protein
MKAGLTEKPLTLREIFEPGIAFLASRNVTVIFTYSTLSVSGTDRRRAWAA